MNAITERNGHSPVALIEAPQDTHLGDVVADSVFTRVEASVCVRSEELVLEQARALANRIVDKQHAAIEELKKRFRPLDAALLRLNIEASAPNLERCFMSVHRELAQSPEGRARIQALVGEQIQATLKMLDALSPKTEVAEQAPLSSKPSEASSETSAPAANKKKK